MASIKRELALYNNGRYFKKKKKRHKANNKWSEKRRLKASNRAKKLHKEEYRNYLLSKEWANIRIDLFASRGRKCEACGSSKKLQVHHLHYRNIFKEEPSDLMILCAACHEEEHMRK